ncbi:putative transcriptional regulator [Pseudomonas savastanoi pv. glycinea]|nr:helix-turn-helix transcriptional regulator [Pseudomonas savastanoi]RMN34007.1 putative transcriptional regulator [Pseudomonas savastanoi pv. glycinea]
MGQTIKRLRGASGLSQGELGQRAGFDPNTISRFELGTVTPSVDALYRLAVELECSVRDFFVDFEDDSEKRAFLFNLICEANGEELTRLINLISQPSKKS